MMSSHLHFLNEDEADRRLALNPKDVEALVAKGSHRSLAGERRAAIAFYRTALRHGSASNLDVQRLLDEMRGELDELERGILPHTIEQLRQAGFPRQDWHPRFEKAFEIMTGTRSREPTRVRFPQVPTMFYYPDLPQMYFFDAREFNWCEQVQKASGSIRDEGLALLARDGDFEPYVRSRGDRPQGDVHGMLDNRDWTTFDLTEKGQPILERIERAPSTWSTISAAAPLCNIPNRAPTVMFSLLKASRSIPPHTGMINARLICHLPLVVPGEAELRVGEERRQWQEGELLAFDDSVEHEAWNSATKDRLVLIFDVWHPSLEEIEKDQIRALFSAVDAY
ncbi:aspartyl/asparaginyl beta-hydroxylase domain-containing protein [Qipengyuania sp. JC766]|uniref:aspartyl/asparaginyl beta-hydroxylase domain-containing protein n=1 Tax=Qipengyuania sp. JC766 TaxID=3232139 RepID=UPI003459A351